MRLNLGCGEFLVPGWVNVDCTYPDADVCFDITTGLPPVDDQIERIYAGHVLEHLAHEDLPAVLASWRRDGALLAVVGPDCDLAEEMVAAGQLESAELDDILHGARRWPGDEHLWRSTGPATADLLTRSGWTPRPVPLQQLVDDGWPVTSLVGWQFGLLCTTG